MEDRLKKFSCIIDYNSFTKAANELHISQPALSAAVKKLERELGAELITHGTQRGAITLTSAGKLAYTAGKHLSTAARNLQEQITTLYAEKIPLRLGTIDSIAEALLVQERELQQLESWAQVALSVNNSAALVHDVHNHALDVAIIATRPSIPKGIATINLGAEPLVMVTHASRRNAALRAVHAGILPDFLSYNRNSTTETLIRSAAETASITLEPSFFSTSPEIMLELILAGRGIAVLPFMMVKDFLADYTLARIPLSKKQTIIARPISAVQEIGRTLPTAFGETLQRAERYLQASNREARSA